MKYYGLQNDALKQLNMVEREMQDSLKELEAINPLYESQLDKEKQTTKRQAEIMQCNTKIALFMLKMSGLCVAMGLLFEGSNSIISLDRIQRSFWVKAVN